MKIKKKNPTGSFDGKCDSRKPDIFLELQRLERMFKCEFEKVKCELQKIRCEIGVSLEDQRILDKALKDSERLVKKAEKLNLEN